MTQGTIINPVEQSLVAPRRQRSPLAARGLRRWAAALMLVGFAVTLGGCGGSSTPVAMTTPVTTSTPVTSATGSGAGGAVPAAFLSQLQSDVDSLRAACDLNPSQGPSGNLGCVSADDALEFAIADDQKYVDTRSALGQALNALYQDSTSFDATNGNVSAQLYTDADALQTAGAAALAGG